MKADERIVFSENDYPTIMFPVGLPENGGSCAYLTEYCFNYCPSRETNEHEIRALDFFKHNNIETIVNKIRDDVACMETECLYWWSWGDCLPELTDKILNIMLGF